MFVRSTKRCIVGQPRMGGYAVLSGASFQQNYGKAAEFMGYKSNLRSPLLAKDIVPLRTFSIGRFMFNNIQPMKPKAYSWESVTGIAVGAGLALGGIFIGIKKFFSNPKEQPTSVECDCKGDCKGECKLKCSKCSKKDNKCSTDKDVCKSDQCGEMPCCLHAMDEQEKLIIIANDEFLKAFLEAKPAAIQAVEQALKALCEARILTKEFMDLVYCAIGKDGLSTPEYEKVWCEIHELANRKCEKVKEALAKAECAEKALCRFKEVLENGKECKYTSCHPLLVTGEDTFLCAEAEYLAAKSKLKCVKSDSPLVEQYACVIPEFRAVLESNAEFSSCSKSCENKCSAVMKSAVTATLKKHNELAAKEFCEDKLPEWANKPEC